MSYTLAQVEVWAADIVNKTGMLARLLEALTNAGAQLEFLISRRIDDTTFRTFLSPIAGARQRQAARDVGLSVANMSVLRIAGPDRQGLGAEITRAVADKGINVRGATAAAVAGKFVLYLGFGSDPELKDAARVIRALLSRGTRPAVASSRAPRKASRGSGKPAGRVRKSAQGKSKKRR